MTTKLQKIALYINPISAGIIDNGGYQWERAKEASRAQLWPAAWSWRGEICYLCWFWALCQWPNTSAIITLFKNVFKIQFGQTFANPFVQISLHQLHIQKIENLDKLCRGLKIVYLQVMIKEEQCFRSVVLIAFVILEIRGGFKVWILYIQRTTLSQRLRTSTDWKA